MPIFQYKGYRPDGSEVAGTIEAASQKDAALRLKESGLYPKNVAGASEKRRFSLFNRHDASLLPSVTRQLSTLISSGVPLMEALRSLSDEQKGSWKTMLVDIRERIAGGIEFFKGLGRVSENISRVLYQYGCRRRGKRQSRQCSHPHG